MSKHKSLFFYILFAIVLASCKHNSDNINISKDGIYGGTFSYGNFLDIIEIKSPTLNDGKLFREVETKNKKKVVKKPPSSFKYF